MSRIERLASLLICTAVLSVPAVRAEVVTTEQMGIGENLRVAEDVAIRRAHGDLNQQCRTNVKAQGGMDLTTFSYTVKKEGRGKNGYFSRIAARCECK